MRQNETTESHETTALRALVADLTKRVEVLERGFASKVLWKAPASIALDADVKPWVAEGVSKATYYRRKGKPGSQ